MFPFSRSAALNSSAATALAVYYQRLIVLGTLVFLGLVGWTLWSGWQRQMAAEVSHINQQMQASSIRLQAIIKTTTDQITQLADWATQFPYHTPYLGSGDLRLAVQQARAVSPGGEFTLDILSALPPEHRLGQLLVRPGASRARPGGLPSNLDLGLSLMDRAGTDVKTTPFLRWTYFNSADKDLLLIAPWVSRRDLLGDEPDLQTFMDHAWTYEVTTAGLPANNPQRQAYWTHAYQDQAGAGLMISHAAPVYWGHEFVGVVATDVLLGFLNDFLREFPDKDGVLTISNAPGQILGDSRHSATAAGSGEIQSLDSVLPVAVRQGLLLDKLQGERMGDDLVFSATLANPNWRIVFQVPQATLNKRATQAFSAQLYLSLLLVLGAFVMHWVLWRIYVAPALVIADFVARQATAAQPDTPQMPQVPRLWRPWLQSLAQVFAERLYYMATLKDSNAVLERRVAERTQALVDANARLEALSVTDPLTSAFNRRHLFELLEAERQRVLRGGEVFSVLMMDLDAFKQVNDTFGHAAGDAVLCEFVNRSQAIVRKTDVICRYGGEEFVAFLPALQGQGAEQLAERLNHAMAEAPVVLAGVPMSVSVSIGVACYRPGESLEVLLSRADARLYSAKNQGRNQVVYRPTEDACVNLA